MAQVLKAYRSTLVFIRLCKFGFFNKKDGCADLLLFSGESFGISWDNDSIIIGKNIRIVKPYGVNCITLFNAGPKTPQNLKTSLNYAKQLVSDCN